MSEEDQPIRRAESAAEVWPPAPPEAPAGAPTAKKRVSPWIMGAEIVLGLIAGQLTLIVLMISVVAVGDNFGLWYSHPTTARHGAFIETMTAMIPVTLIIAGLVAVKYRAFGLAMLGSAAIASFVAAVGMMLIDIFWGIS